MEIRKGKNSNKNKTDHHHHTQEKMDWGVDIFKNLTI